MSLLDKKLSKQQLDQVYIWVDNLPLTKPKRNINRDFSDGVLMAQAINYYFPKQIELHNYPTTNSIKNKLQNWKTLNNKTLSKLGLKLKFQQCKKLAQSTPMCIEVLLHQFKYLCAEEDKERMCQQNRGEIEVTLQSGYMKNNNMTYENLNIDEKPRRDLKGLKVTKVQELKQILKLLKQKIAFLQKNLKRKDAEIKQLQDTIQLQL